MNEFGSKASSNRIASRAPYDHEKQMRLFSDTQAALALNAFEVNEINERILKESEK